MGTDSSVLTATSCAASINPICGVRIGFEPGRPLMAPAAVFELICRESDLISAPARRANGTRRDLSQRTATPSIQPAGMFRSHRTVSSYAADRRSGRLNLADNNALRSILNSGHRKGGNPPTPGLFNRDADNWRPLFAIADEAGGEWPTLARTAAQESRQRTDDKVGSRPATLGDIREIFCQEELTDRLPSATIVEHLAKVEGSPWAEWKAGKPMLPPGLPDCSPRSKSLQPRSETEVRCSRATPSLPSMMRLSGIKPIQPLHRYKRRKHRHKYAVRKRYTSKTCYG